MGIDLVHEYALAARLYGFGLEDFREMNRLAVRGLFFTRGNSIPTARAAFPVLTCLPRPPILPPGL